MKTHAVPLATFYRCPCGYHLSWHDFHAFRQRETPPGCAGCGNKVAEGRWFPLYGLPLSDRVLTREEMILQVQGGEGAS